MIDREILEKKKRLQKVRNTLKEISGIEVLCIYENQYISKFCGMWERLSELGYCSPDKIPDDKIDCKSEDSVIYQWVLDRTNLEDGMTVYLMCRDVWVKVMISDIHKAVKDLWNVIGKQNGLTIVNEDLTVLKEFGSDSRDEYNYLYDEYNLTVR